MELTVDQAQTITDIAGLGYDSFRSDYSGRSMYGSQCIGWDVDSLTDMMVLALAIRDVLDEAEAISMCENARTDNMGMGYIVYFPHHTCPEWDNDEYEDVDDDY